MKKFLSLVLAMIMTMSLVTISAGATEYKDLTDKDEIQYEEAVAVLNRIGVITGYEDGSFRPDTELTRGAAAKIIVSLMIGPDAASALPNTSSPYPDVPASHTFAGVISYCKTLGYISGYGDGTFKPADPLTGYAFSKMLLGALGYSSDIERFTGTGWTMNVARIGNVAGLFDRISFDGAAAVTRDQACQLALNTLKATMVTYGGTSIINGSTGSYTIQGTDAKPITSNNRDINANIGRKDWYGGNNQSSDYLTLEFGEEHFKDLRLEHDKYDPAPDDFGRPSNEWSYKKVTIGTFPLEADFTYTTQVAHVEATDGVKEKALGLGKYDLDVDGGYSVWAGWGSTGKTAATNLDHTHTNLWLNGRLISSKDDGYLTKIAQIADYTDNGTLVEVYVSYVDADWITDVVVVQTQLMKVKKIASDYVTLETVAPDVAVDGEPNGEPNVGFNFAAIDVKLEEVKDTNEDCYAVLTGLKEGDYVAVVPVTTDDGTTYEAAEVYVPETVSGSLTRVDTYGIGSGDDERGAISITVGGTAYKLADWNKDMWSLTDKEIKATRKDATLYMDKYGNALFADDIGKIEDFMVIGRFYQSVVGTKVCTFVQGWDIKGKELDLNLGSSVKVQNHGTDKSVYGHVIGELVHFTSDGATGDADYVLDHDDVHDVYTNLRNTSDGNREIVPDFDPLDKDNTANYEIKASNLLVPLADMWADNETELHGSWRNQTIEDANYRLGAEYDDVKYHNYYYEKGVNFIYVTESDDHTEIDSIEVKSGVQNVSHSELYQAIYQWRSQAAVKKNEVVAVVIKRESNDANLNNMLYVMNYLGMKEYDKETGEKGFGVEVLMYKDGKWVRDDIIVDKDLAIGAYATYAKRDSAKYVDNYYHVKNFSRHNANPGVLFSDDVSGVNVRDTIDVSGNKYSTALLRLDNAYAVNNKGDKSGVALLGLAGMDASDNAKSYVMGNYRGVSTTIDSGYVQPEGIIVTKNATWLNMSKDLDRNGKDWSKVDFKDAKDFVEKVVDEGYKYELTVLLNEKPDSDGFRTAYLIVIDKITFDGKGSGSSEDSEYVAVKNYKRVGNEVSVNLEIGKPEFATNDATTTVQVHVTGKTSGIDEVLTFSGVRANSTTTYRTTSGLSLDPNEDYTVEIDPAELVWSKVRTRYYLNGELTAASAVPVDSAITLPTELSQGSQSVTVNLDNTKFDATATSSAGYYEDDILVGALISGTSSSGIVGQAQTLTRTVSGTTWADIKLTAVKAAETFKVSTAGLNNDATAGKTILEAGYVIDNVIDANFTTTKTDQLKLVVTKGQLSSVITVTGSDKTVTDAIDEDTAIHMALVLGAASPANKFTDANGVEVPVIGYNVTVQVSGQNSEVIFVADNTAAGNEITLSEANSRMNGDKTVTIQKIEPVLAAYMTGATLSDDGTEITMTFNKAIDESTITLGTTVTFTDDTGGEAIDADWSYKLSGDKKSLTIKIDGAVANDDAVGITAGLKVLASAADVTSEAFKVTAITFADVTDMDSNTVVVTP